MQAERKSKFISGENRGEFLLTAVAYENAFLYSSYCTVITGPCQTYDVCRSLYAAGAQYWLLKQKDLFTSKLLELCLCAVNRAILGALRCIMQLEEEKSFSCFILIYLPDFIAKQLQDRNYEGEDC